MIPFLLCSLLPWALLAGTAPPPALAGEMGGMETVIDHRDLHLAPEALSAAEGLPYRYMMPEAEVVKTRIDPRDVYLDPEAYTAAEGLPYRYQMPADAYVPVRYSPRDLDLDPGKMETDDPSFISGQENY